MAAISAIASNACCDLPSRLRRADPGISRLWRQPGHAVRAGFYTDAGRRSSFSSAKESRPTGSCCVASRWLGCRGCSSPTQHEVAAVVLEAPLTSVAEVAQCHFPYVPAALLSATASNSLSRIGKIRAPLLVMHGDRDRVVPVRYGRTLFNAAPEPKEGWFAPEAGHEDLARYGGLEAAVAFIERRLGG